MKIINHFLDRLKFRQKLLLAFLPVPLFAIIIGTLMYENTIDAVQKTLEKQTLITARNISNQIDGYIEERKLEIKSVIKLHWIQGSAQTQNRKLKNLLIDLESYFQISVFNIHKQPIVKVQLTSFYPKEKIPVHFETDIFDKTDIIGVEECLLLKKDQIYISDAMNFHGFKAIILGTKLINSKSQETIGVITFVLPISYLIKNIEKRYNIGFAAHAMIIDSSKQLIYHSDRSKVNQLISAAIPTLSLTDFNFSLIESTTNYKDENDDLQIVSFSPVRVLPWSTGIIVPIKPYIQSTKRAATLGILLTLLASFLILFFIIYISNKFNTSISELTDGARAIAGGDLDQKIPVRTNDEIGELAEDFNKMAADLKNSIHEVDIHKKLSAVGQFAAGMYHDLKSPIEGLKLLITGLKKKINKDDPAKKYVDEIDFGIKNLDRLIYETLDFVKPKISNLQYVNLNELIKSILSETNINNVKLTWNLEEKLSEIKTDKLQIEHVVRNIISNSLESMRNEGVLNISTVQEEESVKIEITDTGTGIKEEDLDKIFQPFYTTKIQGHGLGLSIVHQIIKMNGGEIGIKSNLGEGTKVIIKLPVKRTMELE